MEKSENIPKQRCLLQMINLKVSFPSSKGSYQKWSNQYKGGVLF